MLAEVKSPGAGAGGPGASGGCAAAPVPPGRAVVARVEVARGQRRRRGAARVPERKNGCLETGVGPCVVCPWMQGAYL